MVTTPPRYRNANFENSEKTDVLERVKKFAEDGKPECLVIAGAPGCGKTHAVYALKNHLRDNDVRFSRDVCVCQTSDGFEKWVKVKDRIVATMVNSDFFREVQLASFDEKEEMVRRVQQAPLLVFDDLGVEKRNEANQSLLEAILDYRYNHLLPLIITTNFSLERMEREYSLRIIRRLDEWGVFFESTNKRMKTEAA